MALVSLLWRINNNLLMESNANANTNTRTVPSSHAVHYLGNQREGSVITRGPAPDFRGNGPDFRGNRPGSGHGPDFQGNRPGSAWSPHGPDFQSDHECQSPWPRLRLPRQQTREARDLIPMVQSSETTGQTTSGKWLPKRHECLRDQPSGTHSPGPKKTIKTIFMAHWWSLSTNFTPLFNLK